MKEIAMKCSVKYNMANLDKTILFKKYFSSDKSTRQKVVETVIREIYKKKIKPHLSREELFLIVDEAITNAMEHGNHWDPSKKILVEVIANASFFFIKIIDEGIGFDMKEVQKRLKKRNMLSTRGRGIYIIRQFSETTWNDTGNQIQLKIRRSG